MRARSAPGEHAASVRTMVDFPTSTPTVPTVWHYTDANGLMGILEGQQIWAHSVSSVNDTSEYVYGWRRIDTVWKSFAAEHSNGATESTRLLADFIHTHLDASAWMVDPSDIFVFSASQRPDLLNQWQGYSGAQGYALELAVGGWPNIRAEDGTAAADEPAIRPTWHHVLYDLQEQERLIRDTFDALLRLELTEETLPSLARTVFGTLAATLKHPAFSAEEEVRYVVHRNAQIRESFRPGRTGIRRYLRLSAEGDRESPAAGPLPLDRVMLGPADEEKKESARRVLARLLLMSGVASNPDDADRRAVVSSVPFRF